MSTRIERTETIETLQKEFEGAKGIYMTDFNKIDVEKITQFRNELRNVGTRYLVVKNTLARIALERQGLTELTKYLKGPTGIAVAKDDSVAPAKVIRDFRRDNKDLLEIKAAYLDGSVFNAAQTEQIADLPSKEVLLAQLLSALNAPMSKFAASLGGIFTKLTGTLEAVKAQKEAQGN